jgi:hypothetical protein
MLHVPKVVWVLAETLAKNFNVAAVHTTRQWSFGPDINFLSIIVTQNITLIKCRCGDCGDCGGGSSSSSSSSSSINGIVLVVVLVVVVMVVVVVTVVVVITIKY